MNAPDPLPNVADGHAPPGHRLGGFELRGVLTHDRHGAVYRAWDLELGIAVAVQEYLPLHLVERDPAGEVRPTGPATAEAFDRGRQAFIDETRLLARGDHPSLLQVRQLLRLQGTAYRVMPWSQGMPLLDRRRALAIPPDEAALIRLLDEVLGALETWHRIGGPHGRVNPSTILLLDDDRSLLLEPGLAQRVAPDPADEPGLPWQRGFLAPEQRQARPGAPIGPWSDFQALAGVIRYGITGALPSSEGLPPEPLSLAIERMGLDASLVHYDERFLQALDAAASADVRQRPQSAGEFRDWLEHGPQRDPRVPVSLQSARPGTAPATVADEARSADVLTTPVAAPDASPAPGADTAGVDLLLDGAATPKNEAVDDATAELIRRVIESIPERQDTRPPTAEALGAMSEPIVPGDEPERPDWSHRPARRQNLVAGWLLGAVLLGAAGVAAWEWRADAPDDAPPRPVAAPVAPTPPVASVAPTVPAEKAPTVRSSDGPVVGSADDAQAAAASAATAGAAAVGAAATASAIPATAAPPGTATHADTAAATAAEPSGTPSLPRTRTRSPANESTRVKSAPAVTARPRSARAAVADTPREVCGGRSQFALYRCLEQQCARAKWSRHAQCVQFKARDRRR